MASNWINKINVILASLVNQVKRELSRIWPTLRLINALAGGVEDVIINFSMEVARKEAWEFGESLAPLDEGAQQPLIDKRDKDIALLGDLVVHPPLLTSIVLFVVRIGERGNTRQRIDVLCGLPVILDF